MNIKVFYGVEAYFCFSDSDPEVLIVQNLDIDPMVR